MPGTLEGRLRELARRAGVAHVPTPVLVAGMALLTVGVVAAVVRWWPKPDDAAVVVKSSVGAAVQRQAATPTADASAGYGASSDASAPVWVHVVGAVRHPGVYRLASGSRVEAAVDAAGGATDQADTSAINLAALVPDGTQVDVPTDAEVNAGTARTAGAGALGGAGASAGAGGGGGAPVNLNTADATALDALPGVGPSTAAKIVADRQANGPFKSVDDLGRVPGIGPKKLDQLKPLVSVR